MPRHSIWVIREPQEWPVAKTCYYTFSNMDALFDFVTGLGLIPFVTGRYRVTRTLLSREHGSSFALWLRLQAPPYPSREETAYLKKHALPSSGMEIRECHETMLVDVSLMPLEMELVTIEPQS